ncbi:MAG: hypothetical protein HY938_11400 [Nitrosomonadales bacterium]|nr:hypothetical protein [Nitrosomonadales bacterium]
MAVFFACHAYASDGGDAASARKTKPFGKLSLSLSLTLTAPVSKPEPPASKGKAIEAQPGGMTGKAKTLGELNAEIAAMEAMIGAQQKLLEAAPETSTPPPKVPPIQPSQIEPVPESVTSVETAPVQGAAIGNQPGADFGPGDENPKPKIVVPAVRPVSAAGNSLTDMPVMEWVTGLAVLLFSALGFVWYSKRKETRSGKYGEHQDIGMPHEEPALVYPDKAAAPSSSAERTMKVPANAESQSKSQSILPPEYEMLEEADIYLRFGHDKLAEEALREAIKINPKNPQAYLTLSRVYFSREDKAAFLDVAQQLKSLGEASVWQRVAEMGRNLDADNPLYH